MRQAVTFYVNVKFCHADFAAGPHCDTYSIERNSTMLARPDQCIECGRPFRAEGFCYHEGIPEHGPAYWSDRGILCSPQCSLTHHRKRVTEGTLSEHPAPDPFEAFLPGWK
jgi:hypothetical protein